MNDNDYRLIIYCMESQRSVNEISRHLEISPSSVSVRINKLKDKDLLKITSKGVGKKTFVKTINKYVEIQDLFDFVLKNWNRTMEEFRILKSSNDKTISKKA